MKFIKILPRLAGATSLLIVGAGCALQRQPAATAAPSYPVIVRLVNCRETITITAGPTVPLYSVADTSGHVVISGVSMADLKKTRPDLYEQISPALSPKAEAWAGE